MLINSDLEEFGIIFKFLIIDNFISFVISFKWQNYVQKGLFVEVVFDFFFLMELDESVVEVSFVKRDLD